MSAGHTEGRLVVRQIDDEFVVGTDLPPGEGRYAVAALIRKEPDARRIAACWNACEGIKTDALEKLPEPFSSLLSKTALDYVTFKSDERDQLAAARALLAEAVGVVDGVPNAHGLDLAQRIRTFLEPGTNAT